ncbi:nucleotide sugar dehydrogenase [Legionella jamestowniensis]|uniref:Nucleotide sugar dehydrogenase n=1 Tax=Legionella jamestowniensis TaxID=455 RepID=A0A0W0UJI9_9GAMM|nr:nucleotide sugar dehydrogenase [Legionella jamestowniensis]KTD07705.1 protein capL [Legionella jamestowniensis]OCH99443.1 nucleotide sugar dehydrogenase [Legionella jamestowniensis]SFL60934.1 UDP-N-acetyl-D-galactosamine dehydrogenase [Legionella jamestowniensis DSM 19215]
MKTFAVIGLGYVGLELAISLADSKETYGYDISKHRIAELQQNQDRNHLISSDRLKNSKLKLTNDIELIKAANFYIVAVSTPAYFYELPNLEPLINATRSLGEVLKKGDIVVFESTVYPGTTEEVCIPILEEVSHLRCGQDFNVGYSPERISPGDTEHDLRNIPKVISAQNESTLQEVKAAYHLICDTVYTVSTIKTAEAVKVLENTQRDINIAFMNEFAQIMHALDLDTHEILEGAKTKWSFIPFKPGFVGGHCIAIDPQYLAFKAKRHGVEPKIILAARQVNDGMTQFIIHEMNKILIKKNISFETIKIGLFGVTYKENVPDIRNSLAFKLIKELKGYGFNYIAHDPWANKKIVKEKYQLDLIEFEDMQDISVAIIIVQHDFYRKKGFQQFVNKLKPTGLIMDIPNLFIEENKNLGNLHYWNL